MCDTVRKKRKISPPLMMWAIVSLLASGCAVEQEFLGKSRVDATFRLTSESAMDGNINISQAYLKLDRLEVRGHAGGQEVSHITHSVAPEDPPYQLTQGDSAQAHFALADKTHDQIDLHLFLFQDDYQLVLIGDPEPPAPNPPGGDNEEGNEQEGENEQEPEGEQEQDPGTDAGNENPPAGGGQEEEEEENEQGGGQNQAGGQNNGGNNNNQGGHNSGDDDDEDEKEDDKEENHSHGDKDDRDDEEDDDERDDKDNKDNKDKDRDDKDDKKDKDDGKKKGDKKKNKGKGHDKHKDRDDDDEDDDNGRKARIEAGVVDLDHFFRNARPAMVVTALYENNGKAISIIFAVTRHEKFTIRATQNDGFAIALSEPNTAEVTFDPQHWFQILSASDIESGSTQTYQEQNVLFIHPGYNSALYEKLLPRVEASARFEFSPPSANPGM